MEQKDVSIKIVDKIDPTKKIEFENIMKEGGTRKEFREIIDMSRELKVRV